MFIGLTLKNDWFLVFFSADFCHCLVNSVKEEILTIRNNWVMRMRYELSI